MSDWISVDDFLPEPEKDVLCYCVRGISYGMTVAGRFYKSLSDEDGITWMSFETEDVTKYEVTHWMPLPEPPK